jgi:hypothetical protein
MPLGTIGGEPPQRIGEFGQQGSTAGGVADDANAEFFVL